MLLIYFFYHNIDNQQSECNSILNLKIKGMHFLSKVHLAYSEKFDEAIQSFQQAIDLINNQEAIQDLNA